MRLYVFGNNHNIFFFNWQIFALHSHIRRLHPKREYFLCIQFLLLVSENKYLIKYIFFFLLILTDYINYLIGFMLLSGWAWHVICAPDIFSWNFSFLVLNIGQLVYIVYQMRPVRFDPELEEVYHNLFFPFKVQILYSIIFLKFTNQFIKFNL